MTRDEVIAILKDANLRSYYPGKREVWVGWQHRDSSADPLQAVLDYIESTPQSETAAITAEDKRWRFLEHGCQFVSWTPTGGETVSFDPRDVKHLSAMREKADKTLHEQVEQLRTEAAELNRRFKR